MEPAQSLRLHATAALGRGAAKLALTCPFLLGCAASTAWGAALDQAAQTQVARDMPALAPALAQAALLGVSTGPVSTGIDVLEHQPFLPWQA